MRHPCQSGHRCTCHSAGPSNKTTTSLIIAALIVPALTAPAPVTLPFLYPTLQRRVTDAGQAPDDPSEGFAPEHIQLSDLRKAGLPYKFVYDPTAEVARDVVAGVDVDIRESTGAWVIDDAWQMHGKRFGPLSATATADITDDPLPTQTEAVATASSSAAPTPTSTPTVLAIESTLPTGWADDAYRRSGMYAIPLVVSFSVVIALMIGSLIGALAIRRDRSRSRRRKKRLEGDDDSVTREKVVRKGLAARVGRALKLKEKSHSRSQSLRQTSPRPEAEADQERDDIEVGEHAAEAQRDRNERSELEKRVKSWARRSASWKVQARVGMRRRMGREKKRVAADNDPDNVEVIREDREGEERVEREEAEAEARSRTGSRAPTPIERTSIDRSLRTEDPTPYPASSPVVPTYSSTSSSSAAGPSTPRDPRGAGDGHACDVNDAHADAAPSDQPAYDVPGAGDGLPPAYRRGEGRAEVRRGKMPMRSSSPDVEPEAEVEVRRQEPEQQRAWTALDAYAFGDAGVGAGEEGVGEAVVTAHVATDDKRVLERLQSMRGAPEEEVDGQGGEAPREEDVFVVEGQEPGSSGSLPEASVLPSPPTKAGAGPVARYDEADLSLPKYLDGAGSSATEAELAPSAPPEDEARLVPSAPPAESVPPLDMPSAPPLEDDDKVPSAPTLDDNLVPSAPPMDDELAIPTPTSSIPSAPTLHHTDSSSPLLHQ